MSHPHAPIGTLRAYVLDDNAILRHGLRHILETAGDIVVVGESGQAKGAAEAILAVRPDVVLIGAELDDGSGLDVCRELRDLDPSIRALVLTAQEDEQGMYDALTSGAYGYLRIKSDPAAVVNGVRVIATGHSLIDPAVAMRLADRVRSPRAGTRLPTTLTNSEKRVLDLICEGLTNKQIALALHVSEHTVKNQVTGVLSKLGVARRAQAAMLVSQLKQRQARG